MRQWARSEFEDKYTADANYRMIRRVYDAAIPALIKVRLPAMPSRSKVRRLFFPIDPPAT